MNAQFPMMASRLTTLAPVLDRGPILDLFVSQNALFDHGFRPDPGKSESANLADYQEHQRQRESIPMKPSGAFHLVRLLQKMHGDLPKGHEGRELVAVHVASHQDYDTGGRFETSLGHFGINYTTSGFNNGASPLLDIAALGGDLYLTGRPYSYDEIMDAEVTAAQVPTLELDPDDEFVKLILAMDWDASVADGKSELIFQRFGLAVFQQNELTHRDVAMGFGPLARFFWSAMLLRSLYPGGSNQSRLLNAIVSARGGQEAQRIRSTLRGWQAQGHNPADIIHIDHTRGLSGHDKTPVLQALIEGNRRRGTPAHLMLFDDGPSHVERAIGGGISAALIPTNSRH